MRQNTWKLPRNLPANVFWLRPCFVIPAAIVHIHGCLELVQRAVLIILQVPLFSTFFAQASWPRTTRHQNMQHLTKGSWRLTQWWSFWSAAVSRWPWIVGATTPRRRGQTPPGWQGTRPVRAAAAAVGASAAGITRCERTGERSTSTDWEEWYQGRSRTEGVRRFDGRWPFDQFLGRWLYAWSSAMFGRRSCLR